MTTRNRITHWADSLPTILKGAEALADRVKVTLGPRGRNTVIERNFDPAIITKYDVSVGSGIELTDPLENIGTRMLREVGVKTSEMVGSGSTIAMVLAHAMLREGVQTVTPGVDLAPVRQGMARAVEAAVAQLRKMSLPLVLQHPQLDVEVVAQNAGVPSLIQILEEQGLAREQIEAFTAANNQLKGSEGLPVVSRLLLAARNAGLDDDTAIGIARRFLDVRQKLDAKFVELRPKQAVGLIEFSADSDRQIGMIIAEAMKNVGKDGVITVEESGTKETTLKVVKGLQFDHGYLSPYFVTDAERMECAMEDAHILIHEKKISSVRGLLPILEQVARTGTGIVIVGEDVEGEALATLVINKLRGMLQCVAVKAPGSGVRRKAMLEDIAVLTGGKVLSEDLAVKLENVKMEDLGRAKRVVVDKDKTTIIEGLGGAADIEDRVKQIRRRIEKTASDYEREKLEERLAKLVGSIAVIKVGASTETESKEKKDRVENAVHATRAAMDEGIVPGDGTALLRCIPVLEKLKLTGDAAIGVNIVKRALEEPARQIAHNVGQDGALIVGRVHDNPEPNYGYDADKNEFVDLVKAGVIDPSKVTRLALENAAIAVAHVLTTEALLVNPGEERSEG